MKEIWHQKIGSFGEELNKVEKATGKTFDLSEEQKEQTLLEFLKTDRARLKAFLSILRKINDAPNKEEGAVGEDSIPEIEGDFSQELKTLHILDGVDSFVDDYKEGKNSTLEPRQVASLVKIGTFLRSGKRRGYLELPTGLGKTVIFSELIEALKDVPDIKILVVGSGNINNIQNVQKIEKFAGEEVGKYYAGEKDTNSKITVCNYNGLRNAIKRDDFKTGDFDIVLFDEVHDGLGELTQELIENTFINETLIGFSATATYELRSGKTATDMLPVEIDKMGVVEAVKGNLLSAFKIEVIKIPTTINSVRVNGGDYLPNELEREINTEARNGLVVDSYMNFYRNGDGSDKSISFCVSRQHTKDLAIAFEANGITTGILTGELSIDEREAVLQKWKTGEIEMLCGSKLAWQALDETEVTVGLNVTPSVSEKDVIQRGGRLLRRSQFQNNKRAIIVEFLDEWRETKNYPIFYSEILDVSEAQPDVWKDEELSKDKSPRTQIETRINKPENKISSTLGIQIKPTRISDGREIMQITNQNRKFRNEVYYDYAPKGYMSSNIIAVELGTSTKAVEDAIAQMKITRGSIRRKDQGIYLSALGIKRIFYGGMALDSIYKYFIGGTRSEKIARGDIEEANDFTKLERRAVELDNEVPPSETVDLDWRDYSLEPSFTMEGDSLTDEEEGTAIGDTSELRPPTEPIEGKFNDIVGYRYYKQGSEDHKYRAILLRRNIEKQLKVTERYGIRPNEQTLQVASEISELIADDTLKIATDNKDRLAYLKAIVKDTELLSDRDRIILDMLYINNPNEINTPKSLEKHFKVSRTAIDARVRKIFRILRWELHQYESGINTLKKY